MARRKKPENETAHEKEQRQLFESIANNANRSEKTSWNRKLENMVKLIAKLRPIERQLIALMEQKLPILDDIQALRQTMVKECVHPYEYLVQTDDGVLCKFCNKRIAIPANEE